MEKQTFDSNDIHSAALCAWKEARGEGNDGMCAVLYVLRNRLGAPGFANNLHDVIYGKNQFTSMSVPSDSQFNLQPDEGDPAYESAAGLAMQIFTEGQNEDITRGARYYANLHTMDKDGWFERNIVLNSSLHPITAQIGRHTFFA